MPCMKLVFATAVTLVLCGLGGCASDLIEVRAGSDHVVLMQASQIANCQPKGDITVSVLAKVGFISRSDEDVEANLLQLARNGAVDAGADAVVKGAWQGLGKRTYAMYKCDH